MQQAARSQEELEEQLIADVAEFFYDPFGYALYNWDWDSPPLNKYGGLDKWQIDHLCRLGAECALRDNVDPEILPEYIREAIDDWDKPPISAAVRIATGSGHGVGKTLLTSIIIHWFVATRPNPQAIVTANTKDQLTNKTWRELGKMNGMALNGHWFEHTATKFIMKSRPKTWYATARPNERPNAVRKVGGNWLFWFAAGGQVMSRGTHKWNGRVWNLDDHAEHSQMLDEMQERLREREMIRMKGYRYLWKAVIGWAILCFCVAGWVTYVL